MVAIPKAISEITVDWIRASVRPADAGAFANLISIRAERHGEVAGTSTDIYRLRLEYAPDTRPGPASLVAKMPSSVPEVRAVALGWSTYRREVEFYREIAASVRMRIPKNYVAEFDPDTQWFVLVMEDLFPATDGNQAVGLSLEQVRLALVEVAALHAGWWDRSELAAEKTTTIRPFGEGPWVGTGQRHAAAWPAFAPFVAARASPALLQIGERMADRIEPMMVEMAKAPRTLCHGDFRADNLMFAAGEAGPTVITVDWQAPMQARGAFDVGNLMAMSITTDLRRAHEAELLRTYHDRLMADGVEGYDYDAFFEDYRRGLLIGFTYVVQAGPAVDLSHPLVEALFDSAVRRVDAAVLDHGLLEFVT